MIERVRVALPNINLYSLLNVVDKTRLNQATYDVTLFFNGTCETPEETLRARVVLEMQYGRSVPMVSKLFAAYDHALKIGKQPEFSQQLNLKMVKTDLGTNGLFHALAIHRAEQRAVKQQLPLTSAAITMEVDYMKSELLSHHIEHITLFNLVSAVLDSKLSLNPSNRVPSLPDIGM